MTRSLHALPLSTWAWLQASLDLWQPLAERSIPDPEGADPAFPYISRDGHSQIADTSQSSFQPYAITIG